MQLSRVLLQLQHKATHLDRFIYLMNLLDTNETLFYRTLMSDPARFLEIVYDPTIGEACLKFDHTGRSATMAPTSPVTPLGAVSRRGEDVSQGCCKQRRLSQQLRLRHTSQPCGNTPSSVATDPGACGLRCSRSRRRRCCPSFTHRSPARPLLANGFRSARHWAWCGSMPATRRLLEATLATSGIAPSARVSHRCLQAPRKVPPSACPRRSPSAVAWARRCELRRPEPCRLPLAAHPNCRDRELSAGPAVARPVRKSRSPLGGARACQPSRKPR